MGNVDKKVHGIRLSRQCQIKKKNKHQPAGGNPLRVYFFLYFSPTQSARQCGTRMHTHSHTHFVIHTSPKHTHTHTHSNSLPIASTVSLFLPLSLCLSAPPFPFSIFSFSLCFLHLPSALPYSPHRSLSLSFVRSLTPSPFTRFLPPFIFLLPLSFLCVQSERGHYLSHTGHVRWNGGACNKYSRCKA